MHADLDFEKLFQLRVPQGMVGVTMSVQDIFDTEAFCFDQGQEFIFISGRINDNGIAAFGAGYYICQDLKRFYNNLFYNYFAQIRLFDK
jgi:hypothetical protein